MSKKFYLTTAIAYTSSKPHIGNVYEAILSDAIVRYKRKSGFDVFFQTGTDEHGQKIEQKAESLNLTPKAHVDNISSLIKDIYKSVDISYDKFVRTTDKPHMEQVQKAFKKLYENGDIYKGVYEGYYCVDCESYYTTKDLVEGKCPDCGATVKLSKEESYFLKLSKYQERLVKHINENKDFIKPESRKNEMLNNFLKEQLPDLCVSRSSYKWGIPVSFEDNHVIYVWIDALMNYITGIGYKIDSKSDDKFNKYWPCDVHVIGKDILRFHTIYWPILLMALEIDLPKQIFGHPWILMNHNKMSKSKGNVIYTDQLISIFGKDAVRYYVLSSIPYAQDGNLTYELVCEKSNTDLANTLGNLVSRTVSMSAKYFDSKVSYKGELLSFDKELKNLCLDTYKEYVSSMEEYKICDATETIMKLARRANKYVDETEPWVLAKDESKKDVLENVLYHLLETIRHLAVMLEVIVPETSKKIFEQLNSKNNSFDSLLSFTNEKDYNVISGPILFRRLDVNKDVLDLVLENEKVEESTPTNLINIKEFDKVELVVGHIKSCKKHDKADKLLVLEVDIDSEVRTIVSGIAKFYESSQLIGKNVVIVKNLEPVNLRGVSSHGMILCASNADDTKLEVITSTLDKGSIVR
ncbi:MAG: methionine--tRNA ligase [Anaeroplasmataceae bacterium]